MHKRFYLVWLSTFKIKLVVTFWTLFIAVLCGLPGKDFQRFSFLDIVSFDKWVHAFLFFVLASWTSVLAYRTKINLVFVLLSCIAYGGLLEILQGYFFVDRSPEILDFIANTIGVGLGYWLFKRNARMLV